MGAVSSTSLRGVGGAYNFWRQGEVGCLHVHVGHLLEVAKCDFKNPCLVRTYSSVPQNSTWHHKDRTSQSNRKTNKKMVTVKKQNQTKKQQNKQIVNNNPFLRRALFCFIVLFFSLLFKLTTTFQHVFFFCSFCY